VLCFLGPAAVVTNGQLMALDVRPKALAMLVRLALGDGPQERDTLADLLFPDAANPRESLRWHLSHLRARLPMPIEADWRTIAVDARTDVAEFRIGAERIANGRFEDASKILALYRGDLCAGLRVSASADFDSWLYIQEDELRRTFRRATLSFAEWAVDQRRAHEALPSLVRLTEVDPYLEQAHVLLVRASEASGAADAARHAYDRYQRIVRKELHAEPRPELARVYEAETPRGRTLPIDDLVPLREITMHVVEWSGREPPLLAIHGSAGHAYGLTALGERLAPDVRFLAIDLRGHGFSDKPPVGYGLDDHVQDILQLMATLRLRRPILLGHSIGGAIATFVAAAAQDGVGGLILFDAVVGDRAFIESASFVVAEFGASLEQRFKEFDQYHGRWGRELTDSEWQRWLERSDRMELAPLPDGTLRRRGLRHALEAEWASVAQADSLEALSDVRAPVLVVHANGPWNDAPYLDEQTVRKQLAAARTAKLFVADGSHHADVIRRPDDALVSALKTFVRATAPVTQAESPRH
jgi:pimeloyl-ACP methyl ester carboxylesterase/DNA-binding SARP family transcriptional activator